MGNNHHRLTDEAFERLREQLAAAAGLCGDDQLLDLADCLHDSIRRRREQTYFGAQSIERAKASSGHVLQ